MSRYRVTIPPFEVDAETPEEAESIVDIALGEGAYDYEIEDITDIARPIFLRFTDDELGPYELDPAHTTFVEGDGWTSTRWKPASFTNWVTSRGYWPQHKTELITSQPESEAP